MSKYIGTPVVSLVTDTVDVTGDITTTDATPEVIIVNDTSEDTDGGREGKVTFKGQQSGGEETTLAQIQASHDGTSDDEKGDLIFKTNDGSDGASPTERMRIDSAGQTKITGAGNILTVNAASGVAYQNFQENNTNRFFLATLNGADGLAFVDADGSAERMRIDSNGDVGIGTNDPISRLHIRSDNTGYVASNGAAINGIQCSISSGNTENLYIYTSTGTGWSGSTHIGRIETFGCNALEIGSQQALPISIGTNNTQRIKIESDGATKICADGVSPISGGMHTVQNDLANSYTFMVRDHTSNPLAQYMVEFNFNNASPDNSTAKFLQCRDSTTARLNIDSDGDVTNHDNSYGAISDQKLKEQISDASEQWDDVKALRIRKFKFKTDVASGDSDNHWRLGVIAQEVEASGMNKLIKEEADVEVDDEGVITETGTTTKTVKYSVLYMKAVKALQEAMTRIETLETQNTTQATQIADLITRVETLEGE